MSQNAHWISKEFSSVIRNPQEMAKKRVTKLREVFSIEPTRKKKKTLSTSPPTPPASTACDNAETKLVNLLKTKVILLESQVLALRLLLGSKFQQQLQAKLTDKIIKKPKRKEIRRFHIENVAPVEFFGFFKPLFLETNRILIYKKTVTTSDLTSIGLSLKVETVTCNPATCTVVGCCHKKVMEVLNPMNIYYHKKKQIFRLNNMNVKHTNQVGFPSFI